MKVLKILPEKCTGCMRCELACSYMQTERFEPAKSVIRVSPYEGMTSYAPYTCPQCAEAWCMTVCPAASEAAEAVRRLRDFGHALFLVSGRLPQHRAPTLQWLAGLGLGEEPDDTSGRWSEERADPRAVSVAGVRLSHRSNIASRSFVFTGLLR